MKNLEHLIKCIPFMHPEQLWREREVLESDLSSYETLFPKHFKQRLDFKLQSLVVERISLELRLRIRDNKGF